MADDTRVCCDRVEDMDGVEGTAVLRESESCEPWARPNAAYAPFGCAESVARRRSSAVLASAGVEATTKLFHWRPFI